jgi:hypothetical protein
VYIHVTPLLCVPEILPHSVRLDDKRQREKNSVELRVLCGE